MTVSAVQARTARLRRRNPATARGDRLVPFSEAAPRIGKTPDTLRKWHDEGHLPAVISPGGQWSTYESFIEAVLASARPRQAGVIEEIARAWFAERGTASAAGITAVCGRCGEVYWAALGHSCRRRDPGRGEAPAEAPAAELA